jgi:hypothetical protein
VLYKPLDQLSEQLNPGACRLAHLPERIWVFGGTGSFKTDGDSHPQSLRESFWRQTLNAIPSTEREWVSHLDFPENYPGWWAFSGYDDLLTFERDACHLARAIILFPESPGALAELGALSIDNVLVERLMVVVQGKFLELNQRESFLNLGPIKRAEVRGLRCVIGVETGPVLLVDDFQVILEFLTKKLPQVRNTEALRVSNPTHKLLLIADLVDLLLVCKLPELRAAVEYFGFDSTNDDIRRAAKLLHFFGMIRIIDRGDEAFFVRRLKSDRTWVDYKAKDGAPAFDRGRFKILRQQRVEKDDRLKSVLGVAR